MRLQQEQYAALLHQTDNAIVKQDTAIPELGYGTAFRYRLFSGTGIKASYEHTYRLQEPGEIFGDGLTVRGNPLLTPEHSDNFNLGAYQEYRSGGNRMFFEAGGFLRDAHDFIYLEQYPASRMQQYDNKGSVSMRGVEGEVSYAYARWVNVGANATYQTAINTTKFMRPVIPGDTSARKADVTYRDQLPNRPRFFANMALGAGKDGMFGAGDRLQFNWNSQFVRWFYRTWEAYGDPRGKDVIPNQLVQNASVAYSLKDERLNLSLECNNFTDELAYDNFRFQKPGRGYAAKIRVFLK
jgi:outer membrane receptor protein involved in Fe transport